MSDKLDYPDVLEIFEETPIDEFLEKNISKIPEDIPENIKQKMLNDAKFLSDYGMKSFAPKSNKKHKKAYPNYDAFQAISPQRDLQKWLKALREIYYNIHQGQTNISATEQIIKTWDDVEKRDFKNWMKYYTEGGHLKYKKAQISYLNNIGRIGYNFPNELEDISQLQDPKTHPDIISDEKRNIIEKQRNKIISRLDSAEKLLRSHEGQLFADTELDALLDIIYQLKKKIHMVNKISRSAKIYDDMIIKEANVMTKLGYIKASNFLYKIAQMPQPAEAPNPLQNVGNPGTLPGNEMPGQTPTQNGPTDSNPPFDPSLSPTAPHTEEPISPGMSSFLEKLNKGINVFDNDDKNDAELEVYDADDLPVITAQVAAPPQEKAEQPVKRTPTAEKMQPEGVEPETDIVKNIKNFDNIIDDALANIKVEDVVAKLEDLAKIYRVREIPRQLSLVDMMLDRLNLSALFPTLSEIINKSLESNNYISSRLEDILIRLRGTLNTAPVDLKGETSPPSPDPKSIAIKQKLENQDQKEKERKEMRKQLADQAVEQAAAGQQSPQAEMKQELSEPAKIAPPASPAGP